MVRDERAFELARAKYALNDLLKSSPAVLQEIIAEYYAGDIYTNPLRKALFDKLQGTAMQALMQDTPR